MHYFEIFFVFFQILTLVSWGVLFFVLVFLKNKPLKKVFLILIMSINLVMGILVLKNKAPLPEENNSSIQGEIWDIEKVLSTEKDVSLRVWKRQLLKELSTNLNNYRKTHGFTPVKLEKIESFSPQKLKNLLDTEGENFTLLDVRERVEFDFFGLENSLHIRYGDLANDIFPKVDKNKKIVVLCYSGIRGYLVSSLLYSKGYKNVSFIRGGLGQWVKENIPYRGDVDNFQFLFQRYPELSFEMVQQSSLPKIDMAFPDKFDENLFPNLYNFYGELATTEQTNNFINKFKDQNIILVCHTESECFDGRAFSHLFEKSGGVIEGFIELKD